MVSSEMLGRQLSKIAARLHEDLDSFQFHDEEPSPADGAVEPLYRRAARAKARWLQRVMYQSLASSTEKCFAYAVADHLNCVTLDAWPSQTRVAQHLGFKCTKTVQRAAGGLAALDMLVVRTCGQHYVRYAPVFLPCDEDKDTFVRPSGQIGPSRRDTDVHESLLLIHPKLSDPTGSSEGSKHTRRNRAPFRRSQRGAIEIKVAAMLGDEGMEILSRLGSIDDTIIDRLCRAHVAGALGERELLAARLAAKQAGRR
jgi:hypothetical protein